MSSESRFLRRVSNKLAFYYWQGRTEETRDLELEEEARAEVYAELSSDEKKALGCGLRDVTRLEVE